MSTTTITDDYGATVRFVPSLGSIGLSITSLSGTTLTCTLDKCEADAIETLLLGSGTDTCTIVRDGDATEPLWLRVSALLGPTWRTILVSIETDSGLAAVAVLDSADHRLIAGLHHASSVAWPSVGARWMALLEAAAERAA